MTREEAIKVIRKMLAYTDLSVRANLTADMVDACHLAIKALEQEPVIDKIRAEIEELDDNLCQQFLIENADKEVHHAYQECLEIIDKYKAESEPQESEENNVGTI